MSRKIFAGLVLVFMLCGGAYASDWTSYFQINLDGVGEYISGLFGKEKKDNTASDEILPQHLASDWDSLTGNLTDALKLRDKNDSLPKNSWLPFKEDQQSNARKINALLDSAMKILVNGEAGDMRREAGELREKLSSQRIELDELRNKRINAPESSYAFWRMTKDKADKKISELENEIKNGEERLKEINENLASALKNIGLELDGKQTEILLNSVTGDDLLKNTVIFSNVKSVVTKLEALSQNETNSLEITRRYTGMYLVLNDLLIHTQEELVKKIDGEYKPKLNLIIAEAQNLKREALSRSNQKAYSAEQRKSFAANAKSNEMTIQVANLYGKLLNSQRESTMTAIKNLKLNRDLAENTYRTVRSSGELRGLIHSGLSLFDALDGNLSMPELKIFESEVMRLEFEEINRRLKNS
ncbi:MAG: hypothetical protein IJT20_00105 [Synergistaceae bacterium]|nr:hypothetical protein [Synergistaceae bacterium]